MAYNLIVNVYGSQFTGNGGSAYKWESIEDPTGGGYTVKQLYQGSSPVQDESIIKAYLKLMTGTDYLPVYSANVPNDEFVFCTATEELWKYQYQSGYGLFVFKVVNFPFALKSEIPSIPAVPKLPSTYKVDGTIDSDNHEIVFEITDLTDEELSLNAASLRFWINAPGIDDNDESYSGVGTDEIIFDENHNSNGVGYYRYGNLDFGCIFILDDISRSITIRCPITQELADITKITFAACVVTLF